MISLEQIRNSDPRLKNLTVEELERVRAKLYEMGQFAFDMWLNERNKKVVPNPVRSVYYSSGFSTSGRCTI